MFFDILLYTALYFIFVWIFFIFVIRSERELKKKHGNNKWVMYPYYLMFGLPFVIADFILNLVMTIVYTLLRTKRMGLFTAIKKSLPDFKGAKWHIPLYTHRLIQSILDDDLNSWALKFSVGVCKYMIEIHDFGHCHLYNLRLRIEEVKDFKLKETIKEKFEFSRSKVKLDTNSLGEIL